jgi:hypothetical protein
VICVSGISISLCAQTTRPATGTTPPFSISISSPSTIVKGGASVFVDAVVKNTSAQIISVHTTVPPALAYDIEVWTEKSVRANETKMGRIRNNHTTPEDEREPEIIVASGGDGPLEPGKTLTDHVNVSDLYDLSGPGKYTIQFERFDPETKTSVASNKIVVTVIP